MMKVMYVKKNAVGNTASLTDGKVYDVINFTQTSSSDTITIVDDYGEIRKYFLSIFNHNKIFRNVTIEYRSEIINEILK